jgi:hypothetical protein
MHSRIWIMTRSHFPAWARVWRLPLSLCMLSQISFLSTGKPLGTHVHSVLESVLLFSGEDSGTGGLGFSFQVKTARNHSSFL